MLADTLRQSRCWRRTADVLARGAEMDEFDGWVRQRRGEEFLYVG